MQAPVSLRFVRSRDVVTRVVASETVIVPLRREAAELASVYVLNEVGTWIWSHLDEAPDTESLIDALVGEFEVSRAVAARDVTALVDDLRGECLVVAQPAATPR